MLQSCGALEDNPYFYPILPLLKQGNLQRWELCRSQCTGQVEGFLLSSILFLIIYEAEVSDREEVLLRGRPWSHMNTGWLTKSVKGPVTHIWVGSDPPRCQSPWEDGQGEGGVPCTSTGLPRGVEFLSASIIQEPSQITLAGKMDEVYFCIVLYKDEDRRHFLFCALVLQTLNNQYSLLCATKVKPLKCIWKMLLTHSTSLFVCRHSQMPVLEKMWGTRLLPASKCNVQKMLSRETLIHH